MNGITVTPLPRGPSAAGAVCDWKTARRDSMQCGLAADRQDHGPTVKLDSARSSQRTTGTAAQLPAGWGSLSLHEDRELVVDVPPHCVGTIQGVVGVLAQCGVEVQSCFQYGNMEKLLLVTDAPDKAADALESAGYRCRMEKVVLVGVAAGDRWAGMRIGRALLAAGVQILHSYVSPTLSGKIQAVFQTTDNQHAIDILAAAPFLMET